MRKNLDHVEPYRVIDARQLGMGSEWSTTKEDGFNGMFTIPKWNKTFRIIISDGEGWEHVSVTKSVKACPIWEEMCWVKSLFWEPEEVVMQLHPAESENVSFHDYCLHLWRPVDQEIPLPDYRMVMNRISLAQFRAAAAKLGL